ncbi:hypothetical protein FS837_011811 [Tulasnella sp. UAMH 9824]|nr:hypothetical protein FS837_011811 [Tulasnella sp. UAMH 9824]
MNYTFAGKSQDLFGMASITCLRRVCSRWNATILGEPAFWTHINEEDAVRYSSAVENKVQQSGAFPLTIQYRNWQVLSSSGEDPPEYPEFRGFFELVSRHTHRWKSLSIYAFDNELDKVLECFTKHQFPELEDLKICRGSIGRDTRIGDYLAHQGYLSGRVVPWDCSELPMLVTLEIEGAIPSLDILVEMIQKAENLEELVLSGTEFSHDAVDPQNEIGWPEENQFVTLSKVKSIQITSFQSVQAVEGILECIRAPKIMDIFISDDRENQAREGLLVVKALMADMGCRSILTPMLWGASNMESLKLKGFRESLIIGLDDPVKDLHCKVYLSISEDDWDEQW